MTKDQINAKYVAYVQQTIADKQIPESFDAWNTRRIEDENKIKSFKFVLWSEQTDSWMHITIQHHDKDIAFLMAKQKRDTCDRRYAEDNDAKKVLSPEERRKLLIEKVQKIAERERKKSQQLRDRIIKKALAGKSQSLA